MNSMTEKELLSKLEGKIKDIGIIEVQDLKNLYLLIMKENLTLDDKLIKEMTYDLNYQKICSSSHTKILEELKAKYDLPIKELKKVTTIAIISARYIRRYRNLEELKEELKSIKREEIFTYLDDFKKNSHLYFLHLIKAMHLFQYAGLLDIPIITKENKAFIIEKLNYPDNNQTIFNLLLKLQKKINCTGYALNVALEEIIGEKND